MNGDNNEVTSRFIIYALHHPVSTHMYVGQSSQGMARPRRHNQHAKSGQFTHLPRIKWINSLHKRGLEPEIVILEELASKDNLNEAEIFFISYFKSIGASLLNCTEGGDGGAEISRRYWADASAREKKCKERTGKKWSKETKDRISASHKGKLKSAEHRAKLSAAATIGMKLRWQDPAYQKQQYEIQKRVSAQRSEAVKRLWASDEYRTRVLETRKKNRNSKCP